MSDLPTSEPPTPDPLRGGAGWGVRASTPRRLDPWGDAAVEPALPPAMPPTAPPASGRLPRAANHQRRTLAVAVAAAMAVGAATFALISMTGHQPAGATLAAGNPVAAATSVTPASATTGPTGAAATSPPAATATPHAVLIAAASQEYAAAAESLNAALKTFNTTLRADMSRPCTRPAGQFNAADAMSQVPQLSSDYLNFENALRHIRTELPALSADIDVAMADDQRQGGDFSSAYAAFQHNDPAGIINSIAAVADSTRTTGPDFTRLRADLGLPPGG